MNVCYSVVSQAASGAAIDHKCRFWGVYGVVGKAVSSSQILVHVLKRTSGPNHGYCSEGQPFSGEDAGNSRRLCSVLGSPHVEVIKNIG